MVQGLCTSCGRKKWTNESVNGAIVGRKIHLTTDLTTVLQPSTTPVEWKCEVCNGSWVARVDNIIGKQSGCPHCAGNMTLTDNDIRSRISNRSDILLIESYGGSVRNGRRGKFKCVECGHVWKALIQNVISKGYGCPLCNSNISKPTFIDGKKFHSKLESYFWNVLQKYHPTVEVETQRRYDSDRKFTCDFYFPNKRIWVEVSGSYLLKQTKYKNTIRLKREMVDKMNETFVVLTNQSEITKFIKEDLIC